MNANLALPLVLLTVSACASVQPSVTANGQPLASRSHEVTILAHFDDSLYWHEKHQEYRFDGLFQGEQPVDELDFYAIAGEADAEKKVLEWREHYNHQTIAGWAGLSTGAALVVGGCLVVAEKTGFTEVPDAESFKGDGQSQLGLGLVIAGGVVVVGSYFLGEFLGPSTKLNEWELVLDPAEVGEHAAESYNATLGAPPSAAP
jgi:hypothetical protein